MKDDGVPYGFRLAVERFNKPAPSNGFDRILQETNAKLDKLLKHTYVRISHIAAQDYERAQTLLRG